MLIRVRPSRLVALALVCLPLVGCGDDPLADRVRGDVPPPAVADAGADAAPPPGSAEISCTPVVTSEYLPARTAAMSEGGAGSGQASAVTTEQLFGAFKGRCGNCHSSGSSSGDFEIQQASSFATAFTTEALAAIKSDDPEKSMPPLDSPEGKLFKDRAADDPVRKFAELMEAWFAAGRPSAPFVPPGQAPAATGGLTLNRRVGLALSNLGTCIPSPGLVNSESQQSAELDAMFAGLTASDQLPERLEKTDMVSFDSQVLASQGVIAFAPAYTLWADNAKKMRSVRVPRGQSIQFKADSQTFVIPDNTRFYKTFLRKVIDHRGEERYRKIETRLIVARADKIKEGCDPEPQALFGTYIWNEDETEAVLNRDRPRAGDGFRDRLLTLVVDEEEAEHVIAEGPKNVQQALEQNDLIRHYGVPGSERCVHCHMGSDSNSFILGFTPLQIKRRPVNEGGVIEPAERDELNQLQRLIQYGVITGLEEDRLDQVVGLESSQGDRKPRNDYELQAQGYMLGNCAHCHNPIGYPSRLAAELKDDLIFRPAPLAGHGIFQFPLEKTSKRIRRGANQDQEMPYLSPSVAELPGKLKPVFPNGTPDPNDKRPKHTREALLAPWRSLLYRNVDAPFSYSEDGAIFPHMPMDTPGYDCRARRVLGSWMLSIPSRFKHEDIVASKTTLAFDTDPIFGVPVGREVDHTLEPGEFFQDWKDTSSAVDRHMWNAPDNATLDVPISDEVMAAYNREGQQFEEVSPDAPQYFNRQIEAQARVFNFVNSSRFNDCQDPEMDMADSTILAGLAVVPAPIRSWPQRSEGGKPLLASTADPSRGTLLWQYSQISENTAGANSLPAQSHWAETDLTSNENWDPRRPDWASFVVEGKLPPTSSSEDYWETDALAMLDDLPGFDQKVGAEQVTFRELATMDLPLFHWKESPGCDFSSQKRDSDLSVAQRLPWMETAASANAQKPIYMLSAGGHIFGQVCSSCHGPRADSQGRQAATIADMTGGETRVANLRDGLLGPPGRSGDNIESVFEKGGGLSAEEWAGRYVAWMGLGGTERVIPSAVLGLVFNNNVFGLPRESSAGSEVIEATDANMLTVPRKLCSGLLKAGFNLTIRGDASNDDVWIGTDLSGIGFVPGRAPKMLSHTSGDAEVWRRLCTFDNLLPVTVFVPRVGDGPNGTRRVEALLNESGRSVYYASREGFNSAFGDSVPMGDPRRVDAQGRALHGVSVGLKPDNPEPWCVQAEGSAADVAAIREFLRENDVEKAPLCPTGIRQHELKESNDDPNAPTRAPLERWTIRGAINAGLAVFLYLEQVAKGEKGTLIQYDHCEQLSLTSGGTDMCGGP
jgi:mono/diheme cytochrome c family protein